MSDGVRILTIPRHNPINAYTMGNMVKQGGFTPDARFENCFKDYPSSSPPS
jgi:hypothetical protein